MTQAEFSMFLLYASLLVALIGVVNCFRPTKRWLGAGAIFLGICGLLYQQGVAVPVVAIVGGLAGFCLVRDIGARALRGAS